MKAIHLKNIIATAVFAGLLLAVQFQGARAQQDHAVFGVNGYDLVSYFTDSKAAKGEYHHQARVDGIVYLFTSTENRDAFKEDPAKYLPQYGGWCAFAIAKSAKVPGDPEYWAIVDGRLFINDRGAHPLWMAETTKMIVDGDKYWASLAE